MRSILLDWLDQSYRARAREGEEPRRFAREHAGSELDLIPELESAAAEPDRSSFSRSPS